MAATSPVPFRPAATAADADRALRDSLAAVDHARGCAALWFTEILDRRLFRVLGHPSMEVYARQELGFSLPRTRQFLALAGRLRRMPRLRAAVRQGACGWTVAMEVSRVITPGNEAHWVRRARQCSRAQLREEIAAARGRVRQAARDAARAEPPPAAEPPLGGASQAPAVTITLTLDPLDHARLEALCAAARRSGAVPPRASRAEVLLAGVAALTENPHAERRHPGPAAQVVVQQCPRCEAASVVTAGTRRRLDPATAAAARCDAVERDARGYNRAAVPPSVRRRVLDRDGWRCTTPGCSQARFLDVHHVVPRARGGSNRPDNLVTLCRRCHRAAHAEAICGAGERA